MWLVATALNNTALECEAALWAQESSVSVLCDSYSSRASFQ